jgi:hypothetical protein
LDYVIASRLIIFHIKITLSHYTVRLGSMRKMLAEYSSVLIARQGTA